MAQVTSFTTQQFAADAESSLGRANGNIFQRVQGEEGVHDGQVMIRLKKQRFIVLDYSIKPNEADMKAAAQHPYIKISKGAGTTKCTKPECNKVGVPVCLFDSEPHESDSLYTRSGLCFSCQRNQNEERRADRKRAPSSSTRKTKEGEQVGIIFALGPTGKKLKLGGSTIPLRRDSIVINGAIEEETDRFGDGFHEIGPNLQSLAQEAAQDTVRLVDSVTGNAPDSDINQLYHKAFQSAYQSLFLLSKWKASYDNSVSAGGRSVEAAAAAVEIPVNAQNQPNVESLLLAANKDGNQQGQQNADEGIGYAEM